MAKPNHEIKQLNQRINRYFSESFKKDLVRKIEKNLITVGQASKEYEVSRNSVYKWIYLYSSLYKKGLKQVIEPMSDQEKIKQLRAQIKELEQMLGRKQFEVEFKDKMIELAEELYQIDIKKKFGSGPSDGSGKTGKSTTGK